MTITRLPPSRALLGTAVITWLLTGLGRATSAAGEVTGSGAERAGAFVGALIGTLVIVALVRTLVRLVRRDPLGEPMWTPKLFFVAAVLNVLLILAELGSRVSTAP